MKINENFLLKNIAGKNVVVPVGAAAKNLNGMITLKNESAVYLWECFKEDTAMENVAEKISKEFDIEYEIAMGYVKSFVDKLLPHGVFGD
ncbi:MAG: PqqD family protein [Ruminococcaceae bacterium]|nr:PqqD family protein [Oscillospiraceae bacterium]